MEILAIALPYLPVFFICSSLLLFSAAAVWLVLFNLRRKVPSPPSALQTQPTFEPSSRVLIDELIPLQRPAYLVRNTNVIANSSNCETPPKTAGSIH